MRQKYPGQDARAIRIAANPGAQKATKPQTVVVVGGGIAGLAAACGFAERGVEVHLVEREAQLGGRVRAWNVESEAGSVTMSRGFHAFFRQYYNLRALLSRTGTLQGALQPVADYPVVSATGDRDSFTNIPRTPPWNFITFVAKSPTFTARDLAKVDLDAALSLLDVDFPRTYRELSGTSAAEFLDRLRFPDRARHLALEVFARSFFADPRDFSAGELVAMFHSYFLGSAEGLLFDVPRDDFDTSLWRPLGGVLRQMGVQITQGSVQKIERQKPAVDSKPWQVVLADASTIDADAVVLAAGPAATPRIVSDSPDLHDHEWSERVSGLRLAPPFAVLRLWLDKKVNKDRAAFLGTAGFGALDNVTVLERFEAGAAAWASAHGGSVVELHAYSLPEADTGGPRDSDEQITQHLLHELERVYPETIGSRIVSQQLLVEQDCGLLGPDAWHERVTVRTPHAGIVLAGDWVQTDYPIALMERAATTGWMAANELLADWGVAGHDLWSVSPKGRHRWPRLLRNLLKRQSRRQTRS